MGMINVGSPIENVPKIRKSIVPALKKLGIKTVRDLLFYFPARYEDFSNVKPIREVGLHETVTIRGRIQKISNRRTAKKRMFLTEALVSDGTGAIKALWFNQPFLARNLRAGGAVNLSGKTALGPNGIYLQNPAYEKIYRSPTSRGPSPAEAASAREGGKPDFNGAIHTGGLVAIYPETRGITSRWLRFLIKSFVELRRNIPDALPPETRKKYQLPEIAEALYNIHFPKTLAEAQKAERRFSFEELLLIQLRALKERLKLKQHRAPEIPADIPLIKKFVRSLPFELTDAQRRSIWEIIQDVAKPRPMNRLLEGDVGSGKTVVAAAASLLAVKAGFRVAFMAPTEILARQHFDTLSRVLSPFGIKIGLLIGAEKKERDANIIVGTHALLQKGVTFDKPGLAVVDEQHRFGVEQRAKLVTGCRLLATGQKMLPHFLSMSATPIPRTLALTIYGDLDLSILDEMPKARLPVVTRVVEPGKQEEAYQFIREEVKRGRQAFVVCPRIEKNRHQGLTLISGLNPDGRKIQQQLLLADVKAVKEEYKKLKEEVFKDLKVGMLHGRMKSKEKEAVMTKFRNREIEILVSTSVVEVGVDIPNAAIMMIEGAERFGLAQLHQFRGRVGRGADQSYCFLFPSEDGMITKRLRAVVEAKNGFELAEKDLEIRGPGDIFGIRQWGIPSEVLKAITDTKLVRAVRTEAVEILKKDSTLKSYPALRERLERMEKEVHLE